MSRQSLHWLLGTLAALVVAGLAYWLVEQPTLAIAAGVVWGTAIGLTTYFARRFPDRTTGSGWTDSRWTGLGVAVITFGSLLGVNAVETLPPDLRFVLAAVVLGGGYVGYLTGSIAERERSAPAR